MPHGWDDDVDFGHSGRDEIGDSTHGMQQHFVGAQQALNQLRGALGQLSQNRFNPHAPVAKRVRSQYRDSGQIGINVTQTFVPTLPLTATNWNNIAATGASTVYTSFKPNRVVVNELVQTTFSTSALGAAIVTASVPDGSDLLLSGAFSGSINVFPNAPSAASGVNCAALQAGAFGVGISWPTVNAGIPVTANFLILQSVLFRAAPPVGYTTNNISSITVSIFLTMFGPQLR